ncbi:cell wall hydrolase [Mesobacillus boroniphilus]|uniref:cell wall hydrolase n=1 Tax=Mesobacillus boroniphilus TaxID=308892 RepID=UPI000690AF4E|nr:cell wall hydrolase [Mesobacillus boroniphilus]
MKKYLKSMAAASAFLLFLVWTARCLILMTFLTQYMMSSFKGMLFTAVHDGQFNLRPNNTAYLAVKDALLGWDPSYGSVYYYNPKIATNQWIFTRTVTKQIGNHHFAY